MVKPSSAPSNLSPALLHASPSLTALAKEDYKLVSLPPSLPSVFPHLSGRLEDSPATASDAENVAIPPSDEGAQAWLFLLAAFVLESLVWGFPYSYGVFQEFYLASDGPYPNDQSLITLTGTLSSGLTYMSGVVWYPLIERSPQLRQPFIFVGFVALISGLVGSAFVTTPVALVLTQGFLFSLGGSILFAPVVSYLHEWWIRREVLAYGVVGSATSISGVCFPFVIDALLKRFNSRATLWGLGVVLFLLVGALLPFVKPRLPNPPQKTTFGSFTIASVKHDTPSSRRGRSGCSGSLIQSLGFFLPILFISLYAAKIAPDRSSLGPAALASLSATSMLSTLLLGALSDSPRLVLPLLVFSTLGSACSVLLVWGFVAHTVPGLIGFAAFYGLTSGGYSALWAAMIRKMDVSPAAGASMYGYLTFARGLGNVLSAPISTALLSTPLPPTAFYGLSEYSSLILFTGLVLVISGLLGGGAWVRRG